MYLLFKRIIMTISVRDMLRQRKVKFNQTEFKEG